MYVRPTVVLSSKNIIYRRIDTEYITWVLTVPAIWNESAKAFMRRAALQVNSVLFDT